MHFVDRYRTGAVALVTDLPELRSLVTGLAASRQPSPRVVMFQPAEVGRAWADCDSVLIGPDAVLGARALSGGVNRPSRLLTLLSAPQGGSPLGTADGLPDVAVLVLPQARAALVQWLDDVVEPSTAGAVAVMGGRGGAGASTAAVALARAAVRTRDAATLVDADPYGGGLDLALGMESTAGARWPDLVDLRGGVAARWLLASLPTADGISLVSHGRPGQAPPPPEALAAVLDACLVASPAVVVDLPRHHGPAVSVALSRCALLVVVVPAEVRACAAAASLLHGVAAGVADVRLLVRGPAPSGLSAEDVAEAVGVPTFAEVRTESGLASALERGEPLATSGRSPLRRWADALVASWGPPPGAPWWGDGAGPGAGGGPAPAWGLS